MKYNKCLNNLFNDEWNKYKNKPFSYVTKIKKYSIRANDMKLPRTCSWFWGLTFIKKEELLILTKLRSAFATTKLSCNNEEN